MEQRKNRYTIEFRSPRGCEPGIAEDMARFDGGAIVEQDALPGGNLRSVTIEGRWPPTMARWASFMVGARIAE